MSQLVTLLPLMQRENAQGLPSCACFGASGNGFCIMRATKLLPEDEKLAEYIGFVGLMLKEYGQLELAALYYCRAACMNPDHGLIALNAMHTYAYNGQPPHRHPPHFFFVLLLGSLQESRPRSHCPQCHAHRHL